MQYYVKTYKHSPYALHSNCPCHFPNENQSIETLYIAQTLVATESEAYSGRQRLENTETTFQFLSFTVFVFLQVLCLDSYFGN